MRCLASRAGLAGPGTHRRPDARYEIRMLGFRDQLGRRAARLTLICVPQLLSAKVTPAAQSLLGGSARSSWVELGSQVVTVG